MGSYPTAEDALFDIINYLEFRNIINDEWSDLGIKGAFVNKKIEFEDVKLLLAELVNQEFLSFRPGNGTRNYYKLLKNPFKN